MFSHTCGSYKADSLHIRMGQKLLGFLSGTGDNIKHTIRKSCLLPKLCAAQRGQRCFGSRFDDNGIAGSDTDRRHPAHGNHTREIKGSDSRKYAQRLPVADGVISLGGIHHGFSHHERRRSAGQFHRFLHLGNITGRLLPVLSVLSRTALCQLIPMLIQQIPEFVEYLYSFHHRGITPGRKCLFRAFYGICHFLCGTAWYFCLHLTGTWIIHWRVFA